MNAKGQGSCLVQVAYKYNVVSKNAAPRFVIKPKIIEQIVDKLKLNVCVSYLPKEGDIKSNMAVAEINFPSGYTAVESEESLDALKNTRNVKV